jgi:hypothetical protein
MNFTKPLEPQFPLLRVARPWLYAHQYPRVVFARRDTVVTTSVLIPRLKLPLLFSALDRSVPTCIQPILDRFKFVLIDLDSITGPELRFYVFPSDADFDTDYKRVYTELYPWVDSEQTAAYHDPLARDHGLECLGFLVNTANNTVDYYKYYWHRPQQALLHSTRFDSSGQWAAHWTEQRVTVDPAFIAQFGIENVSPDAYRHIGVVRCEPDQDRQYLTIMQHRNPLS